MREVDGRSDRAIRAWVVVGIAVVHFSSSKVLRNQGEKWNNSTYTFESYLNDGCGPHAYRGEHF
jgi:hypothetical protein